MQCFFSSRNRQLLKKFASSNTLVALDFDGTLAHAGSKYLAMQRAQGGLAGVLSGAPAFAARFKERVQTLS